MWATGRLAIVSRVQHRIRQASDRYLVPHSGSTLGGPFACRSSIDRITRCVVRVNWAKKTADRMASGGCNIVQLSSAVRMERNLIHASEEGANAFLEQVQGDLFEAYLGIR